MIGLKLLGGICLLVAALRVAYMFCPRFAQWADTERGALWVGLASWLDLCAVLMLAVAILAMPMTACAQSRDDVEREIGGAFQRSEISRREHAALAFAVLATAADIYTTRRGIDGGCRESNPLYGPHPPTSRLLLVGAVPLAAGYWAADRPGLDVTIGALVFGAWRLRAAWRNSRLNCYG